MYTRFLCTIFTVRLFEERRAQVFCTLHDYEILNLSNRRHDRGCRMIDLVEWKGKVDNENS